MKIIRKILAAVFLIFIVIISVVPFLWVLSSSFKGNAEIMSSVGRTKIKNRKTGNDS